MLNIKTSNGDVLGDMVPTHSSPLGANGVPSVILQKGNSLYSPSGAFRFTLQSDGNAVLQNVIDATLSRNWLAGTIPLNPAVDIQWNAIWATGTNDKGVLQLDMQDDGNLVVYNGSGAPWASGTDGNPGAFLRMQDDGNLVIYSTGGVAIWSSGTQARK